MGVVARVVSLCVIKCELQRFSPEIRKRVVRFFESIGYIPPAEAEVNEPPSNTGDSNETNRQHQDF